MRLTSRVSYFLATSTNLIEILGSSNRGTVLIRAWMSSISVRMGLIIAESQVQLEDQAKRYLSTMVKQRRSSKGGVGGNTMPGPVVRK
jgi:hypothetical protein